MKMNDFSENFHLSYVCKDRGTPVAKLQGRDGHNLTFSNKKEKAGEQP